MTENEGESQEQTRHQPRRTGRGKGSREASSRAILLRSTGRERAPSEWSDALLISLTHIAGIMTERHKKYGPGNIAAFGRLGLLVRLSDKLHRLLNLLHLQTPKRFSIDELRTLADRWPGRELDRTSSPVAGFLTWLEEVALVDLVDDDDAQQDFPDESIIDTFTDIAGYGTVGLMWEAGWWHLPLKSDSKS